MRSSEAAKNTAELIEESVRNAQGGVTINAEVLMGLQEAHAQVQKVTNVMAEIATASDQQSEGVEQITTAVEQMNQLTQHVAANAEESASASEELAGQAREMQGMVDQFQLSDAVTVATNIAYQPSRATVAPRPAKKPYTLVRKTQAVKGARGVNPHQVIPMDDEESAESF